MPERWLAIGVGVVLLTTGLACEASATLSGGAGWHVSDADPVCEHNGVFFSDWNILVLSEVGDSTAGRFCRGQP